MTGVCPTGSGPAARQKGGSIAATVEWTDLPSVSRCAFRGVLAAAIISAVAGRTRDGSRISPDGAVSRNSSGNPKGAVDIDTNVNLFRRRCRSTARSPHYGGFKGLPHAKTALHSSNFRASLRPTRTIFSNSRYRRHQSLAGIYRFGNKGDSLFLREYIETNAWLYAMIRNFFFLSSARQP
jgi:hypothetical protein